MLSNKFIIYRGEDNQVVLFNTSSFDTNFSNKQEFCTWIQYYLHESDLEPARIFSSLKNMIEEINPEDIFAEVKLIHFPYDPDEYEIIIFDTEQNIFIYKPENL